VTQDFTQIQYEAGFVQDLIICIYTSGTGKDGLNRVYRHFVGKSGNKNDISFVVGAWKILLEENTFQNMKTVNIWSDGGPKHFKISFNMKFLATFQHSNIEINWSYHFFPTYHGCSVCDAATSHAKKKMKNSMINTGVAIRTSEQGDRSWKTQKSCCYSNCHHKK